jgi:hypothetical protein
MKVERQCVCDVGLSLSITHFILDANATYCLLCAKADVILTIILSACCGYIVRRDAVSSKFHSMKLSFILVPLALRFPGAR